MARTCEGHAGELCDPADDRNNEEQPASEGTIVLLTVNPMPVEKLVCHTSRTPNRSEYQCHDLFAQNEGRLDRINI